MTIEVRNNMQRKTDNFSVLYFLGLALISFALLGLRMFEFKLSGAGLHVDEAQYWVWSQHLEWGYFSKPPVLVAIIKASTFMFGDSLLAVKSLAMVCWLLCSWVLGWLAYKMDGKQTAIFASFLLAATLISGLLGLSVTTDAPLTLFWALTMLTIWQGAHSQGRQWFYWWIACGLSLGLGILSKYSALALGLSAAWLLWICPISRRRNLLRGGLIATLVACTVLLPHLIWNASNHWPTAQHTLDITIRETGSSNIGSNYGLTHMALSGLEFLTGQILILGPSIWLTMIWLWRHKNENKLRPISTLVPNKCWNISTFALAFTLPILALGLVQAIRAKAMVNWSVPMCLGVCLWLGWKASQYQLPVKRFAFFCIAGFLLSGFIAIGGDMKSWLGIATQQGQSKWDIWGRMRGWHETLDELHPILNQYRDIPWVTDDRSTLVHATYELRLLQPHLYAWNSSGGVYHHFDWKQPWQPDNSNEEFIWISPNAPHPKLLDKSSSYEKIATAQSGRITLQIWHFQSKPTKP